MKLSPVVAAIVVMWNDLESSLACLASATGSSTKVERVLVDNGSRVDRTQVARERMPEALVVRLPLNGGYAAGCNAGAKEALALGATHLFFLNSDAVVEPGAIEALLAASAAHPDFILGPKIVYASRPDRVWSAGGYVTRPLMSNHHLGKDEPSSAHVRSGPVEWTTGCALFVTAETYRRIGPLDERYFLYLEDTDWCLRAARKGIRTWLVADAIVRHEVSAAVQTLASWHARYYAYRNHYRLALRHSPGWARPLVVADAFWTLLKAGLRSLTSTAYRRDGYYHARTRAVADFLLGRFGPAPSVASPGKAHMEPSF